MHAQKILLHLSLLENVGPSVIQKILDTMSDPAKQLIQLYDMHASDLMHRYGISEPKAQRVVHGLQDTSVLEKECTLIAQYKIHITSVIDHDYPPMLKAITVPPTVLYYRGVLPSHDAIAVVGARRGNYYGFEAIKALIPDLVAQGVSIVSGGAIGIDTVAHEQALRAGGHTVAVLGSGLLCPYPASNRKLFDEMVASGGAVVSPFPLGMAALPGNFPARNRIISGLSKGCLVVQAAQKSGALITARYALDQGRDVFAVPGPIDSPLSAGCHALIKEGAMLVASAKDIIAAYNQAYRQAWQQASVIDPAEPVKDPKPETMQDRIAVLCRSPRSMDDLCDATGLSLSEAHELLFSLQMQGVLEQDFMGMWRRC